MYTYVISSFLKHVDDQVQILILEAQWVPPTNLQLHYKMQKIWLDLQETLNFRNNIETLQNAKPGAFFLMKKCSWYKV